MQPLADGEPLSRWQVVTCGVGPEWFADLRSREQADRDPVEVPPVGCFQEGLPYESDRSHEPRAELHVDCVEGRDIDRQDTVLLVVRTEDRAAKKTGPDGSQSLHPGYQELADLDQHVVCLGLDERGCGRAVPVDCCHQITVCPPPT